MIITACVFYAAWRLLVSALDSLLERRLGEVWRRLEWLGRDTDDRLSKDRVSIQGVSIRLRELRKRLRRCEKALYIDAEGKEEDEL